MQKSFLLDEFSTMGYVPANVCPAKDDGGLGRKAKYRQDGVFILACIQSWPFALPTLWASSKIVIEAQPCYACQIRSSSIIVVTEQKVLRKSWSTGVHC